MISSTPDTESFEINSLKLFWLIESTSKFPKPWELIVSISALNVIFKQLDFFYLILQRVVEVIISVHLKQLVSDDDVKTFANNLVSVESMLNVCLTIIVQSVLAIQVMSVMPKLNVELVSLILLFLMYDHFPIFKI